MGFRIGNDAFPLFKTMRNGRVAILFREECLAIYRKRRREAALDTLQVLGRSIDCPCSAIFLWDFKCMILLVNSLNKQKVRQFTPGNFQKVCQLISGLYVAKSAHNVSPG